MELLRIELRAHGFFSGLTDFEQACVAIVIRDRLAGAAEAPRDPALVVLLLGLDGRRYLSFRALVRAARAHEAVGTAAALEAYGFALEVRRALAVLAG